MDPPWVPKLRRLIGFWDVVRRQAKGGSPALLQEISKALVLLQLQTVDSPGMAELRAGEALAAGVLDSVLNEERQVRAEALLANRLQKIQGHLRPGGSPVAPGRRPGGGPSAGPGRTPPHRLDDLRCQELPQGLRKWLSTQSGTMGRRGKNLASDNAALRPAGHASRYPPVVQGLRPRGPIRSG